MTKFTLNLATATAGSFGNLIEQFEKWKQESPPARLALQTGVHTISPEQAEDLLIRNRKNRSVNLATVQAYGVQLERNEWRLTGQPIIFTERGDLLDGQHRLWACYLTGIAMTTFVVTDIKHEDDLFAFVDNCLPRSAGDALYTAGLNGLSRHVANVIQEFAHRYDEGALGISGRVYGMVLSNREVLGYMQDHPGLLTSAHYIDRMHKHAKAKLGATVATFFGWKVDEILGRETLDDFFHAMVAADLANDHPVAVLRKYIEPPVLTLRQRASGLRAAQPPAKERLALAITALNAMMAGQKLKKLSIDPKSAFVINDRVAKAA